MTSHVLLASEKEETDCRSDEPPVEIFLERKERVHRRRELVDVCQREHMIHKRNKERGAEEGEHKNAEDADVQEVGDHDATKDYIEEKREGQIEPEMGEKCGKRRRCRQELKIGERGVEGICGVEG